MSEVPRVQNILDDLPVLPDVIPISRASVFINQKGDERTGFYHSNGEFNFLIKWDRQMYRVPLSLMERRAMAEGWVPATH